MTRGQSVLIGALALALPALAGAAAAPAGRIAFVRFTVADGHPRIYTLAPGKKAAPRRLPLPGVATASPAWSSTRRLAFIAGRNRPGSRDISGNVQIYVSAADGRHARRLTRAAARFGSLAWSPDGTKLAFVKATPAGNRSSIWTIDAAGGAAHRVTRGAADLEPSWARDGRTIAFLRVDPNTYQGSVWTVRPNGTRLRRILAGMRNVGEPVWSPAGNRLLVHDSHALYSVTPDGHERRTVASLNLDPRGAVEDPQPSWSPDGNWIVFCQLRAKAPEGSDIWIVRADGTGLRRLTHSSGVDTDPAWGP